MLPRTIEMSLPNNALQPRRVKIEGVYPGGKAREETLRSLNNARRAGARKGKAAALGFKPAAVSRWE